MHKGALVAFLFALLAWGCGDDGDSVPRESAETVKQQAPAEQSGQGPRGAHRRLLGTWALDIDAQQRPALNADIRRAQRKGLTDRMNVEYTFTESDFTVKRDGPTGYVEKSYFYRILSADGDHLVLEREYPDGSTAPVDVYVLGDKLLVGQGDLQLQLERKK